MSRYLLDTNVVSELRRPRPHGAVVAWLGDKHESQLLLSAFTVGELQRGIERTRHQDPGKAKAIEAWVDQIIATLRVLPMDAACFREWARLLDGKTDDLQEDAMIAATARIHQLIVATRNEKDFAQLDVQIVNPFKSA
jgi:predicted nucleic acid-binding protein